jgi:predicted HicB family RNase H-like nuclease
MQISEEITIRVSPNIAQAYQKATEQKKASLSTLISIFLTEESLTEESQEEVDFLGKLMD